MSGTSAIAIDQSLTARLYRVLISDWLNFQLCLSLVIVALTAIYGVTIASPYDVQIVVLTVIFAIMGVGWAIAAGLAGQLLLGYISFFGIGAYVNGLLYTKFGVSPWLNLGLGAALAAAAGVFAASISVRFGLKEDYFGLFTVALSQVLKLIFLNWTFARKATGITISMRTWDLGNMVFPEKMPYLLVALGLLCVSLAISYVIQRGRLGYFFAAIRESPLAAEALGVNVTHYRIMAIGISAGVAGSAGVLYSQFTTFIDPEKVFGLGLNFEFLLPPVLGGRLSLVGPLLGAGILRPIKDVLRGWLGGQADAFNLVLYGLILVIGILLLPQGIAGLMRRLHYRYLAQGRLSHGE